MLNPFPLINMGSIGGVMMSWLRVAGTMVLHHPFDPQVYLTQIASERPSFTIAPPSPSKQQYRRDEPVVVQTTVTNTGTRAGDEVVQLYLRDVLASVARPVMELAGVARITLAP